MMNRFPEPKTANLNKVLSMWIQMQRSVRHDWVSSVCTLRLDNNWLQREWPTLLKGYLLAVEHQLLEPMIEPRLLGILEETPKNMGQTIEELCAYVQALRLYQKNLADDFIPKKVFVGALLRDLVAQYPWGPVETKQWIHLDVQHDFHTLCQVIFIQALLVNFVEMVLPQMKAQGRGDMYIWLEEEKDYDVLHFKDTLGAIHPDYWKKAFDLYVVHRQGKMLPGLGFCYLKLLYMGGDILYQGEKGKEMQVSVKFPRITSGAIC